MSHAGTACNVLESDPCFARLKDYFISATGMDYYARRDDELHRRITSRMAELRLPDVASYYELLQSEHDRTAELDRLIELTTVGETHFFRHRELFVALRDTVLPDAIERRRDCRRLRIWSAGCSIGAEPYSVSILLRRELADLIHGWDVTILGTDINNDFLVQAAKAEFDEWAMRDVPDDVRRDCFESCGNRWSLRPEFKHGVSFRRHNLVQDPFSFDAGDLFGFDVILCRNVMIYFSPELNRRIIKQAHERLADGGWLLIGHADHSSDLLPLFQVVNVAGAVLYKKEPCQTDASTTSPHPRPSIHHRAHPVSQTAIQWPSTSDSTPLPVWQPEDLRILLSSLAVSTAGTLAPKVDVLHATTCRPGSTALDIIGDLANQGRLQDAAEACERLLADNDLDPTGHYFYALILGQLNRDAEAVRLLRRAIYLDRQYAAAHQHLGLLLQKHGQHERAARCFRNAVQLQSMRQESPSAVDFHSTIADRSSAAI
ncbi:MAG: CheR family methyltransferase [Planctomycetaceae bacterium]